MIKYNKIKFNVKSKYFPIQVIKCLATKQNFLKDQFVI